jgi:hypothetical protein
MNTHLIRSERELIARNGIDADAHPLPSGSSDNRLPPSCFGPPSGSACPMLQTAIVSPAAFAVIALHRWHLWAICKIILPIGPVSQLRILLGAFPTLDRPGKEREYIHG